MVYSTDREHEHRHSQNRFAVVPTPLRLAADSDGTARGVTIAFLDSGFYPHPDLTQPVSRIVAYTDIANPRANLKSDKMPEESDWHGTMTSVAAAGNGYLSDGVYRGLASEAQLVLVKVSENGRITEPNIERGLRWVIENKERYNIRVVSISLGGDEDASYTTNAVDQAAEDAVKAGIVVVVAAGNSGCKEDHRTVPPANSPSVITVGGYHDNNQLDGALDLYCSSYGPTADGIVKPEIIAPAMWVAAPILPGTDVYDRAEALSQLASAPDYLLEENARPADNSKKNGAELWKRSGLGDAIRHLPIGEIRINVESLLRENKIVATHYQHVDGTSFAAPVVASVVAQMLEANPRLGPAAIKHILISTADRIQGAPAMRQGFGVLNARRAVEEASREQHERETIFFCPPRVNSDKLEFTYHDDAAESVALAGDFNGWIPTATRCKRNADGVWRTQIEPLPPGRYRYKLVVNGERWIEDPANAMKEPDEYGGFNSILHIS
ncbi:MAG TPA: S8 family serine peptidase [Blastocatellia bacterium]|nr:S8 family serine peptidase [Blastocatellia bacterium]